MIGLYVIGILLGILSGFLMKKTVFKGAPVSFVMELPNYRFPSAKTTFLLLWDKAKDFIQRACTVIFLATVIIWFLQSFNSRLNHVADSVKGTGAIILYQTGFAWLVAFVVYQAGRLLLGVTV